MGLQDIVRSGVALAHGVTDSLQDTVQHYPWTGHDKFGKPTYGAAVVRKGLVEYRAELRRNPNGQETMQRAVVTFLTPITANGAAGRQEPIDLRDKLVLPDGTTGPILDIQGLNDPGTQRPYLYVVALGA